MTTQELQGLTIRFYIQAEELDEAKRHLLVLVKNLLLSYTPIGYYKKMNKETKARAIRRLKIAEGQIRGVQKMVEEEKYCIDIITQASAIKEALSSVEDLLLENHLETHVVHQIKHDEEDQAVEEILKVYKLKRKK